MDFSIERVTPEDARELLEYLKKIGAESDNLSFGGEGLPYTVEQERQYIENITFVDSAMFIARHQGRIIGNASYSSLPRRFSHRGEISIAVLKDYWNRGIGSELLKKTIKFAKECANSEVISLEVRSDNASAIALYEKFGFEKIGRYEKFFKIDGQYFDADLMNLYL